MKVKSIRLKKEKQTVYDIETPSHSYILDNGLLSHNSMNQYDPLSISGGRGLYYACSSILLGSSKAKDKESTGDIVGAIVTAKTEKSRFAKEHSKLKYAIKHDGGIHPFYGILEDALESEFVTKPKMGWYTRNFEKLGIEGEDKKWREKEIWDAGVDFWGVLIKNEEFRLYFEKKYTYTHNSITDEDFVFKED